MNINGHVEKNIILTKKSCHFHVDYTCSRNAWAASSVLPSCGMPYIMGVVWFDIENGGQQHAPKKKDLNTDQFYLTLISSMPDLADVMQ